MAYRVFAKDIGAPFSHLVFYSLAQLDKRTERMIGLKSKSPLQEISNLKVRWCLDDKNTFTIEKEILRKLERPHFCQKVVKESYSSLRKFQKVTFLIKDKDFTNYSSGELYRIFKDYLKIWIKTIILGHIINLSDFHFNLLSDKIISLIESKIKESKLRLSSTETFAILTTSTKRSFVAEQDLNLFKLLNKIQRDKKLKNLFQKNKDLKTKLQHLPFWSKIKNHVQKYDWLQYHYLGPTILDPSYFLKLLRGLVKQKIAAKKRIQEILRREKETVLKQRKLKKQLNFNQKELYWIEMAKEFAYLKGLRKEITFRASRSYDSLLKEISRRFQLSLRQLQFMTPKEIFEGLKGKKIPNPDLLNQRIKYCVVYYPRGQVRILVGPKAKKLAQKIKEEKIKAELKEIKGTPAFPGKVRGEVVTIFEAKDIVKMKKGKILVSPATNPNVMPAIVKARAIITDEGGITCHAAIVSRELRIPCVIGTKIATRVLKDGDRVEVDAERGIVKKL